MDETKTKTEIIRDEKGRLLKGTRALNHTTNMGGRPRGLARAARLATGGDNGVLLVEWYRQVWKGELDPTDHQLAAAKWLADRGWGKDTDPEPYADLSDKELDGLLRGLRDKIRRERQHIVDGETVE